MDTKFISSFNLSLPRLGFGCMRFPLNNGKIDVKEAKEMIFHAIKNGLNYFDTAYIYHEGESENFLGDILSNFPRKSYFLTDKLPVWLIKNEEDAERIFNEQLSKCKTDYFDFYLLHSLRKKTIETVEKFDLYNFILQKKKEGKIKYIGFSFHDDNETLEKFVLSHKWDFAQLQLNYWDWNENQGNRAYEILEKNNIPCFVMEPVRGGFLASLAPHVEYHMKNYDSSKSIASWALRWIASHQNIAIVLSGMSNMDQVLDNINTFSNFTSITSNEQNVIDKVIQDLKKIQPIPCTGCRYCMDCSFGVDIPEVFEIYNNYKKTENIALAKKQYNSLSDKEKASNCQKCRACVSKCPQHIDIPSSLEAVEKEFTF